MSPLPEPPELLGLRITVQLTLDGAPGMRRIDAVCGECLQRVEAEGPATVDEASAVQRLATIHSYSCRGPA